MVLAAAASIALLWWRGPDMAHDRATRSRHVDVEVGRSSRSGFNLLSVVARALAWKTVIDVGDAAAATRASGSSSRRSRSGCSRTPCCRAASASSRASRVLTRRMPGRKGLWADARRHGLRAPRLRPRPGGDRSSSTSLLHREDPGLGVDEPRSSSSSVGVALVHCSRSRARASTTASAARGARRRSGASSRWRRHGLGVMRAGRPGRASRSSSSALGWICQLLAVWTAMRAFDIHAAAARRGARAAC